MANGYNVYRGVGGIEDIDWSTPVDTLASGETTPSLVGLGHLASTRYTYAIRPFIDSIETPNRTCIVEFVTDASTEWLGNRPDPPERVTVEALSGAQIKVSWSYRTGLVAAAQFGVYHSTSAPITLGSPDATVAFKRDGLYSQTFTLADGVTYYAVVTAQTTAGAIESRSSNTAGPVVGDSTVPSTPTAYVDSVW